ncbi:STAS domain-containing protein [Siccirubricoccus sp. KC 17139]|uniref:STAS domain-containing protein n=2 Tax=Siccirubricoccus soli TaxID=2899147 RepID=A0ABT1D9N1_9PROT|nr:STAS domain-containing protein [Siccirubricoccus soli]MCP2684758.1 STAS domain-containing protein [Siccirubricoccus soli]
MSGRLDALGAEAIELGFTAAVAGVDRHALVDLREVEFCSSFGLRLLICVARALQRRGRRMVLFAAQPEVAEVFETVALDQMIPVAATEEEALARLGA